MAGVYKADGTIATTTVDGLTKTGIYAADGSINIVVDDASNKGLYHPCGAFRTNSGTSTQTYDPSGAYYSNQIMG